MAIRSSPTILLIPGAFTTSACYDLIVPYLEKAGFPTARASLSSCNPSNPEEHTAATEGQNLLDGYLRPLVGEGKDVIVFAHSFGATALSGSGSRLSKAQRAAAGQSGGIIGIIYNSFAYCQDGQSQIEFLGYNWPPFCKVNYPSEGLFVFDPANEKLFNDTDESTQEKFVKALLPHSMNVFDTPVSKPLWADPALDGRRIAVRTLQDNTFPSSHQQSFAESSGVDWTFLEFDGGHESFLTKPEGFAQVILDAARSLL